MKRFAASTPWAWLAAGVVLAVIVLASAWRWWPQAPAATAIRQTVLTQPITHAQGTTQIPLHPQRVAVFDLAALDTLDALGVEVVGVAGKDFPGHLAKYADNRYVTLGTLFEPDYEAVNATQPDLIITGGRSSAKYGPLSNIAPTIDMAENDGRPLDAAISNAAMLGSVFGKQAQAQGLIDGLRSSVAAVQAQTSNRGRGLVILVTGGKMSAYGPGSRFGIIHTDVGVPPAVDGLATSLHGEAVGSEFIQKTNPDWLFVIDRDAAIGQTGAAQQVLDNPLVRTTTAWKKSQVVYLDPVNWYLVGDGVQALQRRAAEMAAAYARGQ